ncbi:MAG: aminotransferase class IV [Nitrospinae bacterium]|nr:aminotransferase class IV [Nitrospinota bacterium]
MSEIVNINGNLFPPEKAVISVFDHGLLFGDSVYEVLSTRKGRFYTVREHLERLFNSAKGINLVVPYGFEELEGEIKRTAAAAKNEDTYIRIIITRGVGDLNIDPSSCLKPQLIIFARKAIEYPEEFYSRGIELIVSTVRRNIPEALSPGLKTGNYLNNVLAIAEAVREGAHDGLMLSHDGFISECTTSNFFFVSDGTIKTPSLEVGILQGVTRRNILIVAEENGVPYEEGRYLPEDLALAEEAFVSSTTKNILPVTRISGRPVGDGHPGEITRRMMKLFELKLDELVGL